MPPTTSTTSMSEQAEAIAASGVDDAAKVAALMALIRGRAGTEPPEDAVVSRERAMMALMVNHAPASLAYVDDALIYRWNNRAHCEILGLPAEDIIGRPALQAAPGIVTRTEATLRHVLATGEVAVLRGLPIRHRGEDRDASWDLTYVPVRQAGPTLGVLCLGTEVTERVAAERDQAARIEQLQELDRMKDQFLSVVSHELRTPLNALVGFGSALADGLMGDLTPHQGVYLGKMLGAADVLLALIDDLLDVGRIQAGKLTVDPAPVRPEAIVARVIERLRPLFDARNHVLELALPMGLPAVLADERRIQQVISNLLSNAAKFTEPGGTIALTIARGPGSLRIEVRDSGPGIAAADRARLFQPFSQLDMSATRKAGGTGLGLSICKGLVVAHGGEIGVESAPGQGSAFFFTLPTVD